MALIEAYNFHGLGFELHGQPSTLASQPGLALNTFSGFRILGGGAIVESPEEEIFLWASYPSSGQEWEARAKDHSVQSSGVLFVYCIAADIPPADYIIVQNTSPASVNHPQAQATLPVEFVLVGGGARANWNQTSTAGSLLYASRPGSGESWYAAAKDHLIADPATVTAYAIGVRRSFFDALGMKVVRLRANSVTEVAHSMITCGPGDEQEATLISGGAEMHWTGAGGLLKTSSPNISSGGPHPARPFAWLAGGKEHFVSDPNTITAWALALVKCR